MSNKKHLFWFSIITIVFLLTRFLALKTAGSFWFDEAFSVHFAQKQLSAIWYFLQFEHNPLLHFLSLHFWFNIFGVSEFSARSLSALAGLGSLFGIYWLGKRLFSKQTGLWAMLLMTFSSFFLYHQTEARMYSFVAFFAIFSIGSFWNYLQSNQKKGAGKWLFFYLVFTTLLVHTHITAWVLPLAIWVFWLTETKPKLREWQPWLMANGFIMISFLLWFIPVMKNKLLAGHISQGWFFFQQEGGFALTHLTNYFIIGETSIILRTISAGVLLFLFMSSLIIVEQPTWWGRIKNLFDKTHWRVSISFLWNKELRFLLLLIGTGFLFGLAFQITVTKYLFVSGLAILLLIANGFEKLSPPVKVVVASSLLIITMPMQIQLLFSQRHHWDEVAQEVKAITNENPETMILSHSFVWSLPLSFYDYGDRKSTPFYPLNDQLSFEERVVRYNWQAIVNSDNVESLGQQVAHTNKVLLISSTPNADERDPVKQWFYTHGWSLEKTVNWDGYGDPELILFTKK